MNILELTVGEFSRAIKNVVEDTFGYVRIKGEISGFKKASSGHLYFNLKDEEGLLNAVCFKNAADLVNFEMADGLAIVASGKISTFGARSNYQIIVEKIEIAGIGAMLAMIEKRRQKLAAEGLFDQIHKKPIPFFVRKIGVITSETGAVIQDIIHRVEARCGAHLLVYPSATQGKEAAPNVIKAIRYFNKLKNEARPQLLIIARGGGSFEDLLPFNDEDLVREVFKSEIPIISAVGHETDTTLIDFVADLRAPTPTAAAELATPVLTELKAALQKYVQEILLAKNRFFVEKNQQLQNLQKRVVHPLANINRAAEKLQFLQQKINVAANNIFATKSAQLSASRLSAITILHKINFSHEKINNFDAVIKSATVSLLKNSQTKLQNLEKLLNSGHYKTILERGFSLVKNAKNQLVSSVEGIKPKEEIFIEMFDGEFSAYVLSCKKTSDDEALKTAKRPKTQEESIQGKLI